MSNEKYDMERLSSSSSINAASAFGMHYDSQDFFNHLTDFLAEWPNYLRSYNPTVIVYSDEERHTFAHDCSNIRAILTQLGITKALAELNNLENAVRHNDVKSLSDGLNIFFATLEIAAGDIQDARIPDAPPPEKPLILAINDKFDLLSALSAMLENTYQVMPLTNGRAALQALETQTPALIILDVEMFEINGYALALLIRENERFYKTPMLFLTGQIMHESAPGAMVFQFNDFITKPLDPQVLLNKIAFLLGRY